jgi:hypothetical protein
MAQAKLAARGGYDANLVIDRISFHRRRPARPAVAMRSARQLPS